MNFEQILLNKVFCRLFGLVVIEGMTPSGHLSNINEIMNSHSERISTLVAPAAADLGNSLGHRSGSC